MSSKPLKALTKHVGKKRKVHTLKELLPRRIKFVPAEKPDALNSDIALMDLVPLNGPRAALRQHEGRGEGKQTERKEEETEEEEEEKEDPLGFANERLRELLSWNTGVPEATRKELRNVGAGLFNAGNTCFLDATLQCLTHATPLAAYILSGDIDDTHKQCAAMTPSEPAAGANSVTPFCLTCTLRHHIERAFHRSQPFAPKPIVSNLRKICKRFRLGMQEDAHECLRYILDGLQNEALRPYKREQLRILRKQQKGDESAAKPLMKQVHVPMEVEQKTWVHQLFGGHLSSCVHCTDCGHDSVTTDPFLDLSLDIRQCNSVGDALNKFGRKDVLDGDNKYRCSGCKKLVRAYKYFRIDRPPLVLTLHLKRFECNLYGGSSKIGKKIEYPLRLQLPVHVDDGTHSTALVMYDLVGVLIHEGFSMHSGHYYAYVKSITGQWYEADDESVRQVNVKTALSQSAYILVYVRNPNAEPVLVEEKHPETTKPQAKKSTETVELSDDDDDDSDFVVEDNEDDDSEESDAAEDSDDDDDDEDDLKENKKPANHNAMDKLKKALEERVAAKRAQKEDVMELLQKTHAGSLFHANDLPTWDDDDDGEDASENENEEKTGEPPLKKREGGADSPSHWTKKAIMRERHTLIARSTPKVLRPSKWDEEYDQPKLPKIRTEVVKGEDVSGKFDDFLTSAAKKKKSAIVVGDEDDGVHSSCSVPVTSSGFKSNWSKKLQKRLMEQTQAKKKPAGKAGGHAKANGKFHGKHEKRGGKHGGFRGGKHGKPHKFGGPKGKKAAHKKK